MGVHHATQERSTRFVSDVKDAMEKHTSRKIKILRYDNIGEYTSDSFLQLCLNEDKERRFTVRKTSQQNGMAKRMNHTLLEKLQCLLSNAGLVKSFLVEALTYSSYFINKLSSSAISIRLRWRFGLKKLLKIMI